MIKVDRSPLNLARFVSKRVLPKYFKWDSRGVQNKIMMRTSYTTIYLLISFPLSFLPESLVNYPGNKAATRPPGPGHSVPRACPSPRTPKPWINRFVSKEKQHVWACLQIPTVRSLLYPEKETHPFDWGFM